MANNNLQVIEYNGFLIKSDGTYGMSMVRQKGSGKLPEVFDNAFYTKPSFAKAAIDRYVASKPAKKEKNEVVEDAQAESTAGV